MSNLIKAERYKITHRLTYPLGILAMLIIGFLSAEGYIKQYTGADMTHIPVTSISGLFNSMMADIVILIVLAAGILAYFTGREFSLRTLSTEVTSGHDRKDIFISKIIVNPLAYDILMFMYPLGGIIREFSRFGPGDITDNILNILRTSLYMLLFFSVIFIIAMMIAFLLKSGIAAGITSTIVLFMMSYLFAMAAENKITAVNILHPVYYLRRILDIGSSISGGRIIDIPAILVGLLWISVCSIIMWVRFRKSDLK